MALTRPVAPDPTGVKSEQLANFLFQELVGELNATLPSVDLSAAGFDVPWDDDDPIFDALSKPTIEELLAQFHALMAGVGTHISKEYDQGRITGAKYADVYLALMQAAMQSAVQFALGKDQAFWMAAKTQADAITARTQNEIAKIQAILARANYALTKLKLSTEDSQFGQSEYSREYVLPAQKTLLAEQGNAQRAQTSDTRDGGGAVAGIMGAQKELYAQQKQSYIDDTKIKASRIFSDLWTTMKTVDDATIASSYFQPMDEAGQNHEALDNIFHSVRVLAMGTDDAYAPDPDGTP